MLDIAVPYFVALPATAPPWPGIVVVMEGGGISAQLLRVCERLADEGYAAVAPDLFWRFGGSDPVRADEHYPRLRHADGRQDIRECIGRLRALGVTSVGITGFCMGGGYAYLAAVSGDVDAAVPFYGGGIAQHLGTVKCPLLAFFGGRDEWIPRADVAMVERHHDGDVIVYEDAGHGFMRDGSDSYDETAAADAWTRMLTFFDTNLA